VILGRVDSKDKNQEAIEPDELFFSSRQKGIFKPLNQHVQLRF
jgi:hypothetical protein